MVSGLPHPGQIPPWAADSPGSSRTPALAVPVQVITTAFRKEIDGALQASPGAQGALDRKVIQFNVKRCRLAAEHRGRVRV
jgi:hypothetical protein